MKFIKESESSARKYTNMLFYLLDNGLADCYSMLSSLLKWVDEDTIKKFAQFYEYDKILSEQNEYKESTQKENITKFVDVDGIMGSEGQTYTEKDLEWIWKHYRDDDPVMMNYSTFEEWKSDTIKNFQKVIESLREGTAYKRVSYRGEFDNGHVIRGDWKKMSNEDAEELARQKSIKDPDRAYYVQYDDIMNPASDFFWINGKQYHYSDITFEYGKPLIKQGR